ncbi:MAG: Hsp20/alpha crystallin family protein [Planctomycetota bacterium]|nr:Hsp20/alpha crystallin family protein [Planctomycetota bacterium]
MFKANSKTGNRLSNVVGDVESVFNHFLDPAWERASTFYPKWDIVEFDEAFQVTLELPGVLREAVEVEIEQGILRVSGEKIIDRTDAKVTSHRSERSSGKFSRSIEFATPVEMDHVEATFANGLLEIRVPKQEKEKPRKIELKYV